MSGMTGMKQKILLAAVLLLLWGCRPGTSDDRDPRSNSSRDQAGTACGRLGEITLRFPSKGTYLGMVYEGVDYWSGIVNPNGGMGCDDRLLEAAISVTWPEMVAEGAANGVANSPSGETIVLSFRPGHSDRPGGVVLKEKAIRSIDFESSASTWDDIARAKEWNQALQLFCLPGRSAVAIREVCWTEGQGGELRTLIVCNMRPKVDLPLCTHEFWNEERGIQLEVGYRGRVRSQWRDIGKSSITFVERHSVAEKAGK